MAERLSLILRSERSERLEGRAAAGPRRLRTVAGVLIAVAVSAAARAEERLVPSWMTSDKAAKLVTIQLVAGWNANNGALNYNGYYKGDATILVPPDWTVDVKFSNHDGMLPHSVLVTKPLGDHIPEQSGQAQVAISRAYSVDPESGIMADKRDDVRFAARDAGLYWFLCGVVGHGLAGMWINFDVDAKATEPALVIASGAEAGWR